MPDKTHHAVQFRSRSPLLSTMKTNREIFDEQIRVLGTNATEISAELFTVFEADAAGYREWANDNKVKEWVIEHRLSMRARHLIVAFAEMMVEELQKLKEKKHAETC